MTYSHKMLPLPAQYDTAAIEKKWQQHWLAQKTYAWDASAAREDSYVIDTPPPTVSGTLHMGHVFSYTQADFVARFQRMNGKNVFYPMGFDDNGLPTERLVEKTKKIRATDMSREAFIAECMSVSEEARAEFRALFHSIALSVDWDQEYHTISESSRRLSQLSFLDLVEKNQVYRKLQPMLWDPVDQTAIAQAEVEDKELPSHFSDIAFIHEGTGAELIIGTTRPELLPACVALFYHPEDERYQHLKGTRAQVPLFGFSVPILADDAVEPDKGTGLMMCCTFGDEKDIEKWRKHNLPTRVLLNKFGKIDFTELELSNTGIITGEPNQIAFYMSGTNSDGNLTTENCINFADTLALLRTLKGKKVSNNDPKHLGARETILALLKEAGLIRKQTAITHAVKCAERSGAALELIPTAQWFVKVTDKKDALKAKSAECQWNPDWMRLRMEQWIDGLNWDWCISRQRYFGVPFPVWYVRKLSPEIPIEKTPFTHPDGKQGYIIKPGPEFYAPIQWESVFAHVSQLPVNPIGSLPKGFRVVKEEERQFLAQRYMEIALPLPEVLKPDSIAARAVEDIKSFDGRIIFKKDDYAEVRPDYDVMDTWATSSISPQLSAHGIHPADAADKDRYAKLYPADLRPQAHEIIRTWAFYTLVKSCLHSNSIPWKNLMISGWCLAEDKSKMSKSKGNVVTPVALIEERGTDAVRYWAATSRLGMDTAFSPDLLKIGKKLVGKLWNATQFAAIHLSKLDTAPTTAATDSAITEVLDRWILTRLGQTVAKATDAFTRYEYADALDATNQFFWADFCDNYLELIKKRVYNEDGTTSPAAQQSAVRTLYYVLDGILKLYAPFCPHVTEELYAHIFADHYAAKGSLHAKGTWPKAANYLADENAVAMGETTVAILEQVRKIKSDAKRSIKTPVTEAKVFVDAAFLANAAALTSVGEDLKGAGNIEMLAWERNATNEAPKVEATLAAEADAA